MEEKFENLISWLLALMPEKLKSIFTVLVFLIVYIITHGSKLCEKFSGDFLKVCINHFRIIIIITISIIALIFLIIFFIKRHRSKRNERHNAEENQTIEYPSVNFNNVCIHYLVELCEQKKTDDEGGSLAIDSLCIGNNFIEIHYQSHGKSKATKTEKLIIINKPDIDSIMSSFYKESQENSNKSFIIMSKVTMVHDTINSLKDSTTSASLILQNAIIKHHGFNKRPQGFNKIYNELISKISYINDQEIKRQERLKKDTKEIYEKTVPLYKRDTRRFLGRIGYGYKKFQHIYKSIINRTIDRETLISLINK